MRKILVDLFFIVLILQCLNCELIFLQVLYRHGDRGPVELYPTDPNTESTTWPLGLGQLTNIGKEQEFHLGQLIRKHYGDNLKFIDKRYNFKDVYVRSTDVDRTLMSAYCMLAGLFPPKENQTWNANIHWQPIPVHSIPRSQDSLLNTDIACPVFDTEIEYFREHDPEYRKIVEENKDLIKYVSKHSGLPNTFEGFLLIVDVLFCEQTHNVSQPEWLLKNNTIERILKFQNVKSKYRFPTHEMGVIRGGVLLKTMYDNMMTKLKNPSNLTQKLMVFSAHDTTLEALQKTMSVYNDKIPPYSSCIMMELHDDETVRILYRYDTNSDDNVTLTIPGCTEFCPIDEFYKLLNNSMVYDWKKTCGISDSSEIVFKRNVVGYSVMGCLVFLLGLLAMFMCCIYQRQRKQYRYMEVPTDMSET